jgi:hypothetical protein
LLTGSEPIVWKERTSQASSQVLLPIHLAIQFVMA